MTDINSLNRKRGNIKGQLTKLTNTIIEDSKDIPQLEAQLDTVKNLKEKFEHLKEEYFNVPDKDFETVEQCITELDEEIQKTEVRLKTLINKSKFTSLNVNNVQNNDLQKSCSHEQSKRVNLQPIPLPTFSGRLDEWNIFKKQFNVLIHENNELTENEKLFYLRGSLKGDAKGIETANDDYLSLFKALEQRFENKRMLVDSHMKGILNLQSLKHESAKDLRSLLDCLKKNLRSLEILDLERDKFSNALLLNVVLCKLDIDSRKQYELTLKDNEIPDFDEFLEYLERRCQILENLPKSASQNVKPNVIQSQNKIRNFAVNSNNISCKMCFKMHPLYACDLFLKMNPSQRFNFVKRQRLCINCLSDKHSNLSQCTSNYLCRICKCKHNYLLHKDRNGDKEQNLACQPNDSAEEKNQTRSELPPVATPSGASASCDTEKALSTYSTAKNKNIVLATAIVYIRKSNGCLLKATALLDSASQISAVTQKLADNLGLNQRKVNTSISSITGRSITVKKQAHAVISNLDESFKRDLDFLVLPKITDLMPSTQLDISHIKIPNDVILADPNFYIPKRIDILLGGEIFYDILQDNTIYADKSLIFKQTVFGFVACGSITGDQKSKHCTFLTQLDELEENVKKFWDIENLEDSPSFRDEEIYVEKYFCDTLSRDKVSGKYTVNLPIREGLELGETEIQARKQLDSLWKRLDRNPEMKQMYVNFMQEYQTMEHMREIEFTNNLKYIMPHHGVFKADSSTTKLRVVFNASAPSSTGVSLNDCLYKGSVVQDDLFAILLRFRQHKVAFVADIVKMYRMIWINPEQCNLQCILWKNQSDEKPKLFQLKTVTYGTACAPFLATRVLKQLALDEGHRFPLACCVALSDFYVDDILTGSDSVSNAIELQQQLIALMNSGGMQLHKWSSNESILLDQVSSSLKEYSFDETKGNTVKTLGLRWDPREDNFSFKVTCDLDPPTKRSVLSEIARLFDPLGFLGPVITQAKKFLQTLWQLQIDWNQELPDLERKKWEKFRKCLPELKDVKIQRFVLTDLVSVIELHAFSDASKEAYGAVVYLRCINENGEISVSLLCSKSRVAPTKEVTIPRLELCGAVLLARLVKKVKEAFKLQIDRVCLWTDSKIVLAWILKPLNQLKLFVRNRVSVIQDLTEPKNWNHVHSKDNPADILSRGLDADKMKNCDLWFRGPEFLYQELVPDTCDITAAESEGLYLKELREVPAQLSALVQEEESLDIIKNCSSFTKLQRIIGWCLRFAKNSKNPQNKTTGRLSSSELSHALICIVRNVQATAFSEEIQTISKGRPIGKSSHILTLSPFLDSEGVLRVGGRLKNSNMTFNEKHLILLPTHHHFTDLVINHFHVLYFHVGAEGTLSFIRSRFFIIRGRSIVRKIIKQCITCLKVSSQGTQQVMADLPAARVTPSNVFKRVGIDFAGPFSIKTFTNRSKTSYKCYVCIFICFAVKAVHFEIVNGLTTAAFIAALKRFIARRNKPSEIYSDNGSNFVGANNELRKIVKDLFKGKDKIEDYVASEGIKWNFNPPAAPHFGGLWEAGIKSLKHHLKRIIGNSVLSYEEFLTLVIQTEAILNSRPLCPLSEDPNDISALTPAHFLVGSSLVSVPDLDYSETPMNRLSRWQLVQKFTQQIWKRWSREYLNRLTQRPKWLKGRTDFKEGDIVLVKDVNSPGYLKWHLARIVKLHPGNDQVVRVVTIKDKNGTYERPITKITALPFVN